jgi:hypothetical protein
VDLGEIYNSLKDKISKVEDYFEKPSNLANEKDVEVVNDAQKKLFAKKDVD